MSKGLFITGTGTDIGKTYVTALLVKTLRQQGHDVGYYKAAISGAPTVADSDAGFVNKTAAIGEDPELLLSYLYSHAVSPHLAARWEKRPIEKEVVLRDWQKVTARYPYVTVEGSGGIICPTMNRHFSNWKTSFTGSICRPSSSAQPASARLTAPY